MSLDYAQPVATSPEYVAEGLSLLTILLIVGLLCGLAAALVMRGKARSGLGGFVIGFLLGPIGLIIALVIAPDHREAERKSLLSGEMRRCPFCAELIRSAAQKCRYCGSDVPPLEPEAPPPFGERPEGVSGEEWERQIGAVRDFRQSRSDRSR